tara:strand:+ start:24 stop:266 length:243 start_codon:yes stop_codon:yes gene_type:complete
MISKGKTDRKRDRRMCHDNYSGCRPEVKTVEGENKTPNPNSKDWSDRYIITPFKELRHYECTKGNKAPYLIEDITGDEEQ